MRREATEMKATIIVGSNSIFRKCTLTNHFRFPFVVVPLRRGANFLNHFPVRRSRVIIRDDAFSKKKEKKSYSPFRPLANLRRFSVTDQQRFRFQNLSFSSSSAEFPRGILKFHEIFTFFWLSLDLAASSRDDDAFPSALLSARVASFSLSVFVVFCIF